MCTKNTKSRELPISIYYHDGQSFLKGRFLVKPSESERISLDDANKDISSQTDKSLVGVNLQATLNALQILKLKVKALVEIFKSNPKVKENPSFVRQLNSICERLPIIKDTEDYLNEFNENAILCQLSVLNQAVSSLKEFESHKGSQKSDMDMMNMLTTYD